MKLIPAEPGRLWPFKRAVLAVVMLVSLTLVGTALAADGATVSVGDYDVSRGESFTVMVELEGGVDVAGYSFELGFNPAVVEVQSVTVGDFYLKKKNYKAAIERYLEALEYQPNLIEAYEALARAYEKSGEIDKALAVCNEFIAKFPYSKKVKNFQSQLNKLLKKKAKTSRL